MLELVCVSQSCMYQTVRIKMYLIFGCIVCLSQNFSGMLKRIKFQLFYN